MESNTLVTYLLVFLSVLVPYLVVSFCMGTLPVDKALFGTSLPPFFRLTWRYVSAIAAGFGPSFAVKHPSIDQKYSKIVLMSGYAMGPEHLFAGQIFGMMSGVIVLGVGFFALSGKSGTSIMFGLAGAFLGWVYPRMIVEKHARQRQVEIIKSLPFAIDLLASAMRAGLDFLAAVRYYVKVGGKGALAVEFGMLLRQMELGKSRLEALEEMATHVQTAEFTAFVGAVAHGTEIGASIIDTLQIQGEDMRRARFNLAEQKAARAPSIMIFPTAVFLLPAVFAIVLVPVFLRFKAAKGG